MKNVFIIIVTYFGKEWIQKCLEATKPFPVVIVDNNSRDGTVELIKSQFPKVILLEQKENLGFGQANNIGISYALKRGAEYIFLLNQDAYLQGDCISKLMKVQKKNPDYGILTPIHLNGLGDRLDHNFANYVSLNANADFYSDFILKKSLSEVYTVPFVNAAGWLLSRTCLETVGGFDPIFFHYGEDNNYCQRVKYYNLKIGVVPDVFLKHDREERKRKLIEPGSPASFNVMERQIKMKYGNINIEHLSELRKLLKKRKKAKLKSVLKLNLKSVAYYNNEIQLLEKVLPELKKSRELNKRAGLNYL